MLAVNRVRSVRVMAEDGIELEVGIDGPSDARPLVLLHSLGCDRTMWDRQVDVLRHRFLIIRPDIRGHGRSDAPAENYKLERLAHDVQAILGSLAISRAHVCGISLGGAVAQWLAIHAPGEVDRLILANTASRIGSAEVWEARIQTVLNHQMPGVADAALQRFFSAPFRAARPDIVAEYRALLLSTQPAGYIGCCAALRDGDLTPELGRIPAPTLVIAGASDISTPPAQLDDLARRIADARLATLDAGHLSNVEQSAAFSELLRRHLES